MYKENFLILNSTNKGHPHNSFYFSDSVNLDCSNILMIIVTQRITSVWDIFLVIVYEDRLSRFLL